MFFAPSSDRSLLKAMANDLRCASPSLLVDDIHEISVDHSDSTATSYEVVEDQRLNSVESVSCVAAPAVLSAEAVAKPTFPKERGISAIDLIEHELLEAAKEDEAEDEDEERRRRRKLGKLG